MANQEYPWRDKDTLVELYIEKDHSMAHIARKFDVTITTVSRWLGKHDIETDTESMDSVTGDVSKLHDKDTLQELYKGQGKSMSEIADQLDVSSSTVNRWLDKHGIGTNETLKSHSGVKSDLLQDPEFLREKYCEEGLTLEELGDVCGCTGDNVSYHLKKHGIGTDSKSEAFTDGDIGKVKDEEWLREQYHEKGLSQAQIGESVGIEQTVVGKYMRKFGIERRRSGSYQSDGDLERLNDPDYLEREYWDKERPSTEIAAELGVNDNSVRRAMKRFGIDRRGHDECHPSGEDHPRYKGGTSTHTKYFGPNWKEQRKKALKRDKHSCVRCGMTQEEHQDEYNQELHVHHRTCRRDFMDSDGVLDYETANELSNLLTLCFACHRKVEYLPLKLDVR